nr:hypothetical protein CFP56_09895 [Quercus suber]
MSFERRVPEAETSSEKSARSIGVRRVHDRTSGLAVNVPMLLVKLVKLRLGPRVSMKVKSIGDEWWTAVPCKRLQTYYGLTGCREPHLKHVSSTDSCFTWSCYIRCLTFIAVSFHSRLLVFVAISVLSAYRHFLCLRKRAHALTAGVVGCAEKSLDHWPPEFPNRAQASGSRLRGGYIFTASITDMGSPPPPNPRDLLPPLLACLPTSFLSPHAPPALLPLLAPILRQRVNYLSAGGPPSKDGWLPLLSWNNQNASKLPAAIERMVLEPHPVSGEIEMDDMQPAKYRRLDEETLQARLEVEQFDLLPTYVWVENDEHGGTGPGWKLSDLKTLEDVEDGSSWYTSPTEASAAVTEYANGTVEGVHAYPTPPSVSQSQRNDDDGDDYWASYDRAPGQTPGPDSTPASSSQTARTNGTGAQSEQEYYSRYSNEVQPAMDSHDPDEEHPEIAGRSTLTGSALVPAEVGSNSTNHHTESPSSRRNHHDGAGSEQQQAISMPRPLSPTSSAGSVDHLEEQAATMSRNQQNNDRAQRGIQQHISTDIKSLFRLARCAGMERKEFERIIRTELKCLDMMEQDE